MLPPARLIQLFAFVLLSLFFPLPELPLPFLTLKEFLYLWEQDSCQGLHLMERNAGAVVARFLLCQALSSIRYVIWIQCPASLQSDRHPPPPETEDAGGVKMVLTSPARCCLYEIYKAIVSEFYSPVKPCGVEKVRCRKLDAARDLRPQNERAV